MFENVTVALCNRLFEFLFGWCRCCYVFFFCFVLDFTEKFHLNLWAEQEGQLLPALGASLSDMTKQNSREVFLLKLFNASLTSRMNTMQSERWTSRLQIWFHEKKESTKECLKHRFFRWNHQQQQIITEPQKTITRKGLSMKMGDKTFLLRYKKKKENWKTIEKKFFVNIFGYEWAFGWMNMNERNKNL